MNKKVVVGLVILGLIVAVGAGIYYGSSLIVMMQNTQKSNVKVENRDDIGNYSYSISSYSKEIKHDVEAILRGNTELSNINMRFGKVKYYSKDYPIERYPVAITLRVEILPLSNVVEWPVEIGTTERRYLDKEKSEFNRLSYGRHEGKIFIKGYRNEPFIIEKIGDHKFKIVDFGAPRWNVDYRIYETFTKNYYISYIYTMSVFAGERPLAENEETGEIIFNDAMQSNFKEIEKIISEIKW